MDKGAALKKKWAEVFYVRNSYESRSEFLMNDEDILDQVLN